MPSAAAAPSIDLLAPDIYLDDFKAVCAEYTQNGNPLFIPESSRDERAGLQAMYALGHHHALGFAPFGTPAEFKFVGKPRSLLLLVLDPVLENRKSGTIEDEEENDRENVGSHWGASEEGHFPACSCQ